MDTGVTDSPNLMLALIVLLASPATGTFIGRPGADRSCSPRSSCRRHQVRHRPGALRPVLSWSPPPSATYTPPVGAAMFAVCQILALPDRRLHARVDAVPDRGIGSHPAAYLRPRGRAVDPQSDLRPGLIAQRVIPVLRLASAELTERAIDCLREAGFGMVEITVTTPSCS